MDEVEQERKVPWAIICITTLLMVFFITGAIMDQWSEGAQTCFVRGGVKYDWYSGKCFKVEIIGRRG